jgi:hypothetical protein
VPAPKPRVTIRHVADELGMEVEVVRSVLKEIPGVPVTRATQDKVFQVARRLGYDFRKLKIGKRMAHRKETLEEVLEKISHHPHWTRGDIVKYLKESVGLVDRVHKRAFMDEYGDDGG